MQVTIEKNISQINNELSTLPLSVELIHKISRLSYELTRYSLVNSQECRHFLNGFLCGTWNINDFLLDRLLLHSFDCIFRESTHGDLNEYKCLVKDEIASLDKKFDDFSSVFLYRGALLLMDGARQDAFELYYKAAEVGRSTIGLPRMYLGANSIGHKSRLNIWQAQADSPLPAVSANITWVWESKNRSSSVIFFGADKEYFKNFAIDVVSSIDDAEQSIHFHVVGWDDECKSTLCALLDISKKISITNENFKYFRDRTWFATVRFYRAIQILEHYQCPVYISDIDNMFINKAADVIDKLHPFDIGLRINSNGKWFPWWGPSAGSVYINYTQNGMSFAQELRRYISNRFTINGRENWWFDQLALNEVYEFFKCKFIPINCANLSDVEYHLSVVRPYEEVSRLKEVR